MLRVILIIVWVTISVMTMMVLVLSHAYKWNDDDLGMVSITCPNTSHSGTWCMSTPATVCPDVYGGGHDDDGNDNGEMFVMVVRHYYMSYDKK